jgi:hypothetical protein
MSITAYGRKFETTSMLNVELYCFRERLTPEQGALGRTQHFIRICKEIWPSFEWHEWAVEMAEGLCEYDISGFTSGASSGKSEIMAKFVLVSWFSDPMNSLCIVCSTTAVDARQKIWGHLVRNFREARAVGKSVGTLIESMNIIRLSEKSDGMAASDNASISLVAAGDDARDDALKRLQGRHQKNVMLALDELQDCSQEIITTALGNLSANEHFEVHAAGNASSRFDAHGIFLTPVEGWSATNRYTHKWKIKAAGKEGMGYHFDGTSPDSPNMKRAASGMPQIPYLRTAESSAAAKISYGELSPIYLRQYVGYWPEKDSETNYIVTDAALAAHQAYDRAEWKSPPINLAGIDPSYSDEGDRFALYHLKYGLTVFNVWTVEFYESVIVKARPVEGQDLHHANIAACKRICAEREISPRHVGMDASAGSPLLSIAHKEWSPEILGVQFGGAASDLAVSQFDKRIASDIYANRTSELAYVFVEFLNAGQVRGIKPDHAKELTARQYELVAGGKIKIESKKEMKKRLGFSPDLKDAGNIGLAVIRERLGVKAGSHSEQATQTRVDWRELQKKRDVVTLSANKQQPQQVHQNAQQAAMEDALKARSLARLRGMLTPRNL